MRTEHRYFDVFPRIVRAGQKTTITIKPLFDHWSLDHGPRDDPRRFSVSIFATEGAATQTRQVEVEPQPAAPADGSLHIRHFFESEQEYVILLEDSTGSHRPRVAEFRIYALDSDLFARRPYKGDFHMHSYHSDGRESPAYVAGASRRIGLDFMAITDHRRYAPSLEAMRAFEDVKIDLRIYPGEEVHPPGNPVHIVNFGGGASLNEQFREGAEAYLAEVGAIEGSLAGFPPEVDLYPYASCVWCFDKIREAGGLGVFCHPYWLSRHRYDVPEYLTTQLFERQPYDALELIGGYHRHEIESNSLQVARYHDERTRGKRIPIVGASDAHGCERGELFGWFYTIVFSPSLELPDLIQSIKDLYSVAIEALPGETPHAYGPFRLVKYACFLMRELLPEHDELCVQEGRLMLAHAAGDPDAEDGLRACRGRTTELYDRLWAAG